MVRPSSVVVDEDCSPGVDNRVLPFTVSPSKLRCVVAPYRGQLTPITVVRACDISSRSQSSYFPRVVTLTYRPRPLLTGAKCNMCTTQLLPVKNAAKATQTHITRTLKALHADDWTLTFPRLLVSPTVRTDLIRTLNVVDQAREARRNATEAVYNAKGN